MPSWFVKTKRAQSDTDDEGWAEGAVHPTLNVFDLGDVRTVAIVVDTFPIQNTVIGRSDTAGPQGRGHGDAGGPMFTLDTGGGHAVAIPEKIVRRLTPLECERLQGFPDDWTLVGEKSVDSSRYKQMGNAVTTNVIAWIGSRL
jgi:site-specific DNA-cytosine methylase